MLKPATSEAMDLMLEGSLAMSRISRHGMRVDLPYLDKAITDTKARIVELEAALREAPEMKAWIKRYGNKANIQSKAQLGHVIFDVIGHKRNPFMKDVNERDKNNIAAFEHLKLSFVSHYQEVARLKKALATNMIGLKREVVDGRIHPFISLSSGGASGDDAGGAESYRSSSSAPNFQNQPIRNKDISRIVRSAIVPSDECCFLEVDYSTQEVKVSYCYNKDPKLRKDILEGDMHTDRALEIYDLSTAELGDIKKEPGKTIRYVVKNRFVFAQFYGSYYGLCAPELWDAISIFDLKTAQGVPLFKHLQSRGINGLGKCDHDSEPLEGTFEHHVASVERSMWRDNYTVYNQWRKDWWDLYVRQGGVNTLTGFKLEGYFRRNQILCNPIQGSAFHCLLWAIIQIQAEFLRRKMKSRICLQVHDSLLIDARLSELSDVIEIVNCYALKEVASHYKWLIIPLGLEFEIAKDNWFSKEALAV